VRPDLSLIRAFTRKDAETWRPVSVMDYQKGKKHLYYINAQHVTGIDNPTCKTVREAVRVYKPELVIIEGLTTECGMSPASYMDYVHCEELPRHFPGGEPAYASFLASEHRIPFIGGEPSDEEVFSSMAAKSYDTRDILAFYVLRQIPQWLQEHGVIEEVIFTELAARYLDQSSGHVPEQASLTLDDFAAWYSAHKGECDDFLAIAPDDFAPYASPEANYFQRLNYTLGIIRERHLDTLIADSLKTNDKVMVVYGDAHLVRSSPVFEKMFGSSTRVVLNSNQELDGSVSPKETPQHHLK
jgi:hypothetical protein